MVDKTTTSKLHGSPAKEFWREERTKAIENTCEHFGLTLRYITPYQIQVDGRLDLFPTNGRYHFLPADRRGAFHTDSDLYGIIVKLLRLAV
jgi:hypothetical protein